MNHSIGNTTITGVRDNGGETVDRYTIFFEEYIGDEDEDIYSVYGMSEYPSHPQGFCQYVGDWDYGDGTAWEHVGKELEWGDIPQKVQLAIERIATQDG